MQKLRSILVLTSLSLLALSTASASDAVAQDQPWTAHAYPQDELIHLGAYDKLPIEFPWQVSEVRQVPVGPRMDFVVTVDEDANTLMSQLEEAHEKKTKVATLTPDTVPFQQSRELRVLGHSVGEVPGRFTLGSDDSQRFLIQIEASGDKTEVIVRNFVMAELFSGVVPARAAFTPRSANPINFLWN